MKKKTKIKDKILLALSIVFSLIVAVVIAMSLEKPRYLDKIDAVMIKNPTFFSQKVISMSKEAHQNYGFYDQGRLIGYLSSELVLNELFQQAYIERFQESFPDAKVGLGADAYLLRQTSYYNYENIDEQIINYINDNELFAVEATKITFSNGVSCYVKNLEIFTQANEAYLLNFVTKEDYDLLRVNQLPDELIEYGIRTVGLSVLETAVVSKGFASPNRVFQNEDEVLQFLGYGDKTIIKDYVVEKYDTIQGVAVKNGISIENLMTINKDKLISKDQALAEGEVLNVAGFNSPINVQLMQESLEREILIPNNPKIVIDPNYPMDYREVLIEAREGYQDTLYLTTKVNGDEYSSELLTVTVIEQPVEQVIRVGSAFIEDYGGLFAWPAMGRRRISCHWMCYAGHQGLDIQPNGGNSYGIPILAAADGVVVSNTYDSGWGWYVKIKHVGGYHTLYAHQNEKSPVVVGQNVARGQVIGVIGNTGRSYGPHLHFEIYVSGVRHNPCLWLGC